MRSSARNSPPARGLVLRLAGLTLLAALTSAAQPRLLIEGGMRFDFGELYTTSPVVRDLRLSNGGADTLRISEVSGSCGCTGTLLSESAVPPGGSAILKVTFDPSKFRGKVEKVVSMKTNDPADPDPHISFTATISPVLDFDASHLTFSTLVDSVVGADVTIRNASERTFRITGVKSSSEEVTVELSRDFLEPGGEATLRCSVKQARAGILRGAITISTDHPSLPSVDLPFFSFAKSPVDPSAGSAGK